MARKTLAIERFSGHVWWKIAPVEYNFTLELKLRACSLKGYLFQAPVVVRRLRFVDHVDFATCSIEIGQGTRNETPHKFFVFFHRRVLAVLSPRYSRAGKVPAYPLKSSVRQSIRKGSVQVGGIYLVPYFDASITAKRFQGLLEIWVDLLQSSLIFVTGSHYRALPGCILVENLPSHGQSEGHVSVADAQDLHAKPIGAV
mmetsp:Transcript_20565/g.48307  ORF Transcript_20565/g.48307 Transcript_20565/m.48307 type:complete len:200 (-) Transcript_20565:400-999(-)